jgi:hypothetical protein
MAETRKVLGQLNPGATTLTAIYTVPAATQAVVSSIVVCNEAAVLATFRVSVAVAGAGDNPKQYIYYDLLLPPNDTFIATVGLALGAGDVVRAYASSATLAFQVFGVELT